MIYFEVKGGQDDQSLLKREAFFLNLITLIFLIILSPAISFADADKIFKENSKAVVIVVTYDDKGNPIGQGSGFIVRADGAIVTNYHVISNAETIKVKVGDKTLDVEGLIHTDKENESFIIEEAQNLNFAIPVNLIKDKIISITMDIYGHLFNDVNFNRQQVELLETSFKSVRNPLEKPAFFNKKEVAEICNPLILFGSGERI